MKKWILKAIIQKTISFLPFKHQLNYFFQKHITKGVQLSDYYFEDKLIHLKQHISNYQKHQKNTDLQQNFDAFELGTGWYPVIPIGLYLYGANQITTIDISKLLTINNLEITIEKFEFYQKTNKLQKYLPDFQEERYQNLINLLPVLKSKKSDKNNLDSFLAKINIQYLIADARKLDSIKNDTFDLIVSNNTFEHIYPNLLIDILKEFKRIVKVKDGVQSHFIDMSDHFAHYDTRITVYNFLRFSTQQWHWIDNSIQPQSRLRLYQYKAIYAQLDMIIHDEISWEYDLEALKKVTLAAPFDQYSLEENAVIHTYLVS